MTTPIPVLGDQLSHDLSSRAGQEKSDCIVLIVEVEDENILCAAP